MRWDIILKKLEFKSNSIVFKIDEVNIRIFDAGKYYFEDHDFLQREFKKGKLNLQHIDSTALETILKFSFEYINIMLYLNEVTYFKKEFIQEELLRRKIDLWSDFLSLN